jgi:hypothetical protein
VSRGSVVADRPSEHLRRAQELLRATLRRNPTLGDPEELAQRAGLPVGAVLAAARGTRGTPRLELPADGSEPPGLAVRQRVTYPVVASEPLRAELGGPAAEAFHVQERLLALDDVPVQFRVVFGAVPDPGPVVDLLRPVDVEAVRADDDAAAALGIAFGAVVLLQVVLGVTAQGDRRLDFAYSRADLVRIVTS